MKKNIHTIEARQSKTHIPSTNNSKGNSSELEQERTTFHRGSSMKNTLFDRLNIGKNPEFYNYFS